MTTTNDFEVWLILFLAISFIAVIGCKSTKNVPTIETNTLSKKDNVQILRADTLSGYLYNFYQEKCPGTKGSDKNSPCVRSGNIYTQSKLNGYSSFWKKDSLLIHPNQFFVLDYFKVGKVIPSNLFTSSDSTKLGESLNRATLYLNSLLYDLKAEEKKINKKCNADTFNKVEIIECKLDHEIALIFTVTRDLIRYATSPDIGIANRGMPLKYSHDSLTVAWFVPKDSPILNHLPDQNN